MKKTKCDLEERYLLLQGKYLELKTKYLDSDDSLFDYALLGFAVGCLICITCNSLVQHF